MVINVNDATIRCIEFASYFVLNCWIFFSFLRDSGHAYVVPSPVCVDVAHRISSLFTSKILAVDDALA